MEFDKNGRIILPNGVKAGASDKKLFNEGTDSHESSEEKKDSAVIDFDDKTPKKASWNLYRQKEDADEGYTKKGSIFQFEGERLDPLKFSNGKTQEDIIHEVMKAVNSGIKLIFIKGACGSGKSAIALNLAKHFKKTSIVVPIKNLQDQYERDYAGKNFILKEDGKRLKISVIKGRGNFPCLFNRGKFASDDSLPCDIELREKNMGKILEYIGMNEDVKKEDFSSVSDVRRVSVAAACPYWSPILPAETGGKVLGKAKKRKYMTISGKEYALFQRAKGCGYYDQYNSYIDSDVLIFNSMKYLIETAIGRKPKTDLDIIDECDEFLDSFANEKKINLNRLIASLTNLMPEKETDKHSIKDIILAANSAIAHYHDGLDKLAVSQFYNLFKKILDNPYLAEEEDNNYYNQVFESVKSFESLVDESYVACEKSVKDEFQQGLFSYSGGAKETVFANLVTINIGKRFKELIAMNNVFVLMSGTVHSEQVLRDVFGLENFKIIEAENKNPGFISKIRTGQEKACSYENFKSGAFTRKDYLKAFSACVKKAKAPLLVHVSAFSDLPTDAEKKQYELDNLVSKEELYKLQDDEKLVDKFKAGKINVLFSTKCSRGVDFPGEQCNSIILTKYPYPNIQGIFWRILKEEQPTKFREFYMDKAKRELIQKVARGVRFKNDHVLLFSPDSRVLDARLD